MFQTGIYLEPIASGWLEWIEEIGCKFDAWIDGEEIAGNGVFDDNDVVDPFPSPFDINPPELEQDKDAPTNPLWPKLWLMWLNPKSVNNQLDEKYFTVYLIYN